MTIAGAWATVGDDANPVNRDGITGGEEIRPADGGGAGTAFAPGPAYERGALKDVGSTFGEATYGNKGDDAGTT